MNFARDILEAIGNTPLVQLRKIVPPGSARILVKLEGMNPTGSMKDRMARAMIEGAEAAGRLKPKSQVVEFTGGSTGTSLAMVCAAKGYPLFIITSDAFSLEKRNHMKAFGAALTIVPSEEGKITKSLFYALREKTQQTIKETGAFWTDQFHNTDQVAGYVGLADEVWQQSQNKIDAFVHAVGTGGSLRGVATVLRRLNPAIHIVAVEPAESSVLSGGQPGAHRIEGTGTGEVPPMWDPELVNEIQTVSTEEAENMARRLAREEAIFVGTSSGANLVAALRIAGKMSPESTVVTLMVDSGLKYISTELYR